MRNSANQPSSPWVVATSQYEFQSSFMGGPPPVMGWPSAKTVRSVRAPAGFVTNQTAFS